MNNHTINRREFIQLVVALGAATPLSGFAMSKPPLDEINAFYSDLQDPWLTLAEVQQHLLPSDQHSPGARDILALRFLRNMLDAPDTDDEQKAFIFNGVGWLNDFAQQHHQKHFSELDHAQKEILLRKIETSRAGSNWLSRMMTYLIEALLSDPVYGGNRNGLGWQWLEHQPGFPTPGEDKVYFRLGAHASDRRRTKA